MSVLLSTEVNAENVIINEPKTGKTSGFKSAKIRYNLDGKRNRFFLQTGKKMKFLLELAIMKNLETELDGKHNSVSKMKREVQVFKIFMKL